jgi:hypothetical protein
MTRISILAVATLLPTTLAAQQPASRRANQVSVEANFIGGAAAFAAPVGRAGYVGVQLGLGGDWLGRTVSGGPHFTENGGDQLVEVGHLALFYRQRLSAWLTLDVGARIAPAFHGNDLDDDVAPAAFAGAYAQPMLTWRRLSVGPRIMAGTITEFDGPTEFGLAVAPLTVRITFQP